MHVSTSLVPLPRPPRGLERIHPAFLPPSPFPMTAAGGLLTLGFPRVFPAAEFAPNSAASCIKGTSFTIDAILGATQTKGLHTRLDVGGKCSALPYHTQLSYADVRNAAIQPGNADDTVVTSSDWQRCKGKRVRTIFTPEQLQKLEKEFERQQYMVGTERYYLAGSLKLSEAQVKVWFQNRRIKWRKQHLEAQQARLAKLDLLLAGQQRGDNRHVTRTRDRQVTCHASAFVAGGSSSADVIDMKFTVDGRLDHVAASRDLADEPSFINRHETS